MDHKLVFDNSVLGNTMGEVDSGMLFISWMILAPEGIRFGQWVVNEFLEKGSTWPELFNATCPIKAAKLIDEQLNLQREAQDGN